ncbi:hypothetical protein O3G_MSEX012572 [Manduca sexta]|uniref:Uncharacterized protein n=1 Tax=Manduca sexta TaxID=7130 RepID=A0A921ZPB9_MANSE|nr:hypothetical protein O3G_MSEX012572 [Manduca sexta]
MRRGGRIRGRGRNQPARLGQVEPLISERMQNIDMELELLKQKREMIEQQQLMLENQRMYDQQRKYAFDKPRYEEMYDAPGPSGADKNVCFYDDTIGGLDYIPLSSARKRPASSPSSVHDSWPHGASAKHVSRKGNVIQSFGSRLGPQPPKKRGKGANKPVPVVPPKKNIVDEQFMLRPDREPSVKVKGRLELALGSILKEIKENYANDPQFESNLRDSKFLVALKTAIRGRLRSLMMNKFVAHGQIIFTMYRDKYPINQDTLFLKKVMKDEIRHNEINHPSPQELKPPLNEDFIAAPMNPANYIKNEVGKVLNAELREIFRKLEIIHNPKIKEKEKARRLAKESVDPSMFEENENDTEEIRQWKWDTHQKIRQKLPKALIRNVPLILKLLRLDLVYINTWTRLMANAKDVDEGGVHKLEVGIQEESAFAPRYCAKVRGHPKLPPKIRQFLEPFKPIWVKRNKMVRNLVYVSFRDRTGLEQLLKKNGTDFGHCFLRISARLLKKDSNEKTKTRPKVTKKKRRSIAFSERKKQEAKSADDSLNISSDLDNQIDDLLSSIRNAEDRETDLNTAILVTEEIKTDLTNHRMINMIPKELMRIPVHTKMKKVTLQLIKWMEM